MNEDIPQPDPPLTQKQNALVAQLSEEEINDIDKALLAHVTTHWRKVAAVAGFTMGDLENRVVGIPDIFYAQRVRKLVEGGLLESQGNLNYMCFSEIRLPEK